MEVEVRDVLAVLRELYPRELDHAISETRARLAEQRLAELETDESDDG